MLKRLDFGKREGNFSPRIAETYGGIINSVGLQNPGLDRFLNDYENKLKDIDSVIIANIAGNTVEDYCVIAERLNASKNIDMLELNISCPNVKKGEWLLAWSLKRLRG